MAAAQHLPPFEHGVPDAELTLEAAHEVMRTHIDCSITACPIKLYAKTLLVRHRHLEPAERPKFGF
ncbi:hypothetical protein ACQP0C_39950 [Nocardia sp. CA-129566]|uniref:hypothetical protein n=1 Tax=Nocardia sp. CA-129566 TaxID=3239976 RepID=UPI003D9962A8